MCMSVVCFEIMAAVLKETTNLAGLAVAKNGRKRLLYCYEKILKELSKMPESSTYRKHTQDLIQNRAGIVKQEASEQVIEQKIGCGQIEELIIQAENELKLSRRIHAWKPWENLKSVAPQGQWKWPPH